MELINKPYRISSLLNVILYKLYVEHVNDSAEDRYSVEEIVKLFSTTVSRNLVKSALELGRTDDNSKLILRSVQKGTGSHLYHISSAGLAQVENELRRKNSDISYYAAYGDDELDEVAGLEGTFQTDSERLIGEPWHKLNVNKDEPSYKLAVDAVSAAIKTIKEDNQFAHDYPDVRAGLVETLESGLQILQQSVITRTGVLSSVIQPLRAFIGFMGKAAASVVAHDAVVAVVNWLGTL